MGSFDSRGDAAGRSAPTNPHASVPDSCPTCQSTSITTTAKIPDSTSYWRCTKCGDVWNDARRQVPRSGGHRWR
jgi:transposase-like protein